MTLLEELLALSDEATTVARRGGASVHESRGLRWLYSGGRSVQSVLDLAAPERILLPASEHMLVALLLVDRLTAVLDLGCGGGAFARFLACHEPACRVHAVDASAEVVALASACLGLPRGTEVRVERAEQALAAPGRSYDLIFCDLFSGERHAPCLAQADFHGRLARRLARAGAVAINLSPVSEADLLSVLLPLRSCLPWVMLAGVPDCGNVVLLGSRREPAHDSLLRAGARRLDGRSGQAVEAALANFVRLPPPGTDGSPR